MRKITVDVTAFYCKYVLCCIRCGPDEESILDVVPREDGARNSGKDGQQGRPHTHSKIPKQNILEFYCARVQSEPGYNDIGLSDTCIYRDVLCGTNQFLTVNNNNILLGQNDTYLTQHNAVRPFHGVKLKSIKHIYMMDNTARNYSVSELQYRSKFQIHLSTELRASIQ